MQLEDSILPELLRFFSEKFLKVVDKELRFLPLEFYKDLNEWKSEDAISGKYGGGAAHPT